MKRHALYILMVALSLFLLSCQRDDGRVSGPSISFTAADPQTKAFIDDINRSGNELVVYDYMTGTDKILVVGEEKKWYIDHARIHCTVDGQKVWDYVDNREYFWLYGSNHNCFGWLFTGPSGYNTITFFGEHPEFQKDRFLLPLPSYTFTMESPLYDFLYSDITERSYTQENPDSSPIALKMNHLFSAFRFQVRSVRETPVTIKSAKLYLVTKKQANIDFSNAGLDAPSDNKAVVSYLDTGYGTFEMSRGEGSLLTNVDPAINLFDLNDADAYRMVWPQSEAEFKNAVLEIKYVEDGKTEEETKTFALGGFSQAEWLAGNRYSYELVFTDQEIILVCSVKPWDRKPVPLEFTNVVVVSDKIQWHNSTVSSIDEEHGNVILKNSLDAVAECYFKIDAPVNTEWTASFDTLEGDSDAFVFVNPAAEGGVSPTFTGEVGKIGILKIKVTKLEQRTNRAKLRITVKTSDGRTIVVENLCAGHHYNEYTIIQNM